MIGGLIDRVLGRESADAERRRMVAEVSGLDSAGVDRVIRNFSRLAGRGRNLHAMTNDIMALGLELPHRRAGALALWIANYGGSNKSVRRVSELGITRAKWLYSGAPCIPNDDEPTSADLQRDAAHAAANGMVYRIDRGLKVNGKWTHPGREPWCKCTSRSLIPGVNYDS